MNREIKFRFWLGHICKMTYEHSLSEVGRIIPDFTEDIIPLQFTGLEDKNGKEIYEGDIVNFSVKEKICTDCAKNEHSELLTYGISKFCPNCGKVLTDSDFITTSKVVFDKGGFAYEWSNERNYYQSWKTCIAETYLAWTEVIGNIYENAELINR